MSELMSQMLENTGDEESLKEKVALVTGSSSGIGAAIAIELAAAGAKIVLHGRSESEQLNATAGALEDAGRELAIATCDFTHDSIESFCDQAWNAFGRIDILINNAGADVLTGAASKQDFLSRLDLVWKVDVRSTLLISRLIGQRMKKGAGSGHLPSPSASDQTGRQSTQRSRPGTDVADPGSRCIINVGWDQAANGMEGDSGEMFATTKGAIMAMSRSLAQSLAPEVRVNCVAPGWIQTAWGKQASDPWQNRAVAESLMGRWGEPSDVAAAVRFLASPRASFISGQVIPINGGFRFTTANRIPHE